MKITLKKEEIPWPKKGDELFKSDIDWAHNACLNYTHDMSEVYISGYKLAGDVLVGYIKQKKCDQDLLVYPIGFLYRQYLELRLKDIIKLGIELYDMNNKMPTHHKIVELWALAKEILKKAWPKGDIKDLAIIEKCIKEYAKADPASQSFRYSEDREGNKTLEGISHINLRNLANVIERISSLLDGASCGLSEELELKKSIESEYRDEQHC
ncbi:MAG: hypothetical protein A2987_01230 [Omnitrophica bacterium RIFCSPLOWO2_01_FULL_45_10]|nr:MAG: hypothetical protein A2987_01230 [Omnitrophica bacterium RIFCSPLOWO2_01_FULL_45_10]